MVHVEDEKGLERQAREYPRRQIFAITSALAKATFLKQLAEQYSGSSEAGSQWFIAEARLETGQRDFGVPRVLIGVRPDNSMLIGIADEQAGLFAFDREIEQIQVLDDSARLLMITPEQTLQKLHLSGDALEIFRQGLDSGIKVDPNLNASERGSLGQQLERLATGFGAPSILQAARQLIVPH